MCLFVFYICVHVQCSWCACKRVHVCVITQHMMYVVHIAKQKYWRTLYLVVCSENTVGGILNWWISLLYKEKPMLVA